MTDDPLVSTAWLAERIGDPSLRVVDASYKMPGVTPVAVEDYRKARIPDAVFFDIDAIADRTSPLPHMLPNAAQFSREVGALGIGDAHQIIIYDAGNWMGAPRAWWTFRAFGRNDVKVLDGGLKKWTAESHPVTAEPRVVAACALQRELRCRACAQQGADDRQSHLAAPSRSSMPAPMIAFAAWFPSRGPAGGRDAFPAASMCRLGC